MRFLALALVAGCAARAPMVTSTFAVDVIANGITCTIDDGSGYTDTVLRVPLGAHVKLQVANASLRPVDVNVGSTRRSVATRATETIDFVASRDQGTWSCDGKQLQLSVEDPASLNRTIARAHADAHPTTLAGRIAFGEKLYLQKGCVQCHTIDGAPRVGPSWKAIWGTTVTAGDGQTRTVDAAYVHESIVTPQAFVVATFPPVMPTFARNVEDREIDALTAFIESLK
ncbi:MAG TPA: cytochrome c [Kofleriaceae bacterium]|jgi:mono/diheme cytochrome c family protein